MSETNSASGSIRVEVNGKDLMANKIKNDRKFHIREDLSTQQLQELVNDATLKSDLTSQANKTVSKIADEELGLVDKNGNPCTLAQKKAEINKLPQTFLWIRLSNLSLSRYKHQYNVPDTWNNKIEPLM